MANSLGGVQVSFFPSGVPAPLTYVSANQINAVVPYEIAGSSTVQMQIQYQGQTSLPFTLQAASTAPGIFTITGAGTGQAAVLNDDGLTVNGPMTPEPRGGILSLFMTGEGQTTPAGLTGTITTTSPLPPITPAAIFPVTVNVDGLLAPVLFYGEAPGLVSGVMQVNLQDAAIA